MGLISLTELKYRIDGKFVFSNFKYTVLKYSPNNVLAVSNCSRVFSFYSVQFVFFSHGFIFVYA